MIIDSGFRILAIYLSSLLSKVLLLWIGETDGYSHRWGFLSSKEGKRVNWLKDPRQSSQRGRRSCLTILGMISSTG